MTTLEIRFLPVDQISPELDRAIDTLDHLAFTGGQDDDPNLPPIEWGSPDWMALGFLDGELISQLCLHKREIVVGTERVWVAGVGGVATHPDWLRRGFASQVLRASETFIRDELQVPFGLLVCADQTQPVYVRCGWRNVARALTFIQDEKPRRIETCVMILPLSSQAWPAGEINLLGLPW